MRKKGNIGPPNMPPPPGGWGCPSCANSRRDIVCARMALVSREPKASAKRHARLRLAANLVFQTFNLGSRVPAGKAAGAERREPPRADRLTRLRHQPQVERDVVQAQQRRPQHLIGREQM